MTFAPRFGPRLEPGGGVTFRLWAPAAKQVELVLDAPLPMQATGHGWYERHVDDAGAGTRYRFLHRPRRGSCRSRLALST